MVRRLQETAGGLLAMAVLLGAVACATGGGPAAIPTAAPSPSPSPTATPTATPTPTPAPTATPTPTPTKKPFFPTLTAIGGGTFAQVTGAPAGSVCSVRAYLKSGGEISGPGLTPRTVQNPSTGAIWDSNRGDVLLKPGTAAGQKAEWRFTCTNPTYQPSPIKTQDFETQTQ
jgi:hypothetical protein